MENTNQQKRDRREWTIMSLFASAYSSFPIGQIEKSERPDFLVNTSRGKSIGIELTELKYERNDTAFNMRAHEDFLGEIMLGAQQIFERTCALKLVVDAHFSDQIAPMVALQKTDCEAQLIKTGLSETIARIVLDNLPESTGKRYIVDRTSKYGDQNLPSFIEGINIANVSGRMDEQLWFASISTRVKPLSVESIAQRIADKDEKIRNYNPQCQEMWLVIIQNSFLMSSSYDPIAAERALKHRYRSRFDRVFVFERSESKVRLLNIIRKM